MQTTFRGKHFINLEDFTKEEVDTMLEVSLDLKKKFAMGIPTNYLPNQSMFLMFFEQSTRTRNSMEAGFAQLGGHAGFLDSSSMQIAHGESAKDIDYWLKRLSGNIVFIKGDDDFSEDIEFLLDYVTVDIGNRHFCLVHNPADAPEDFDGWTIHAHNYSHDLQKHPFVDRERKTINISLEATEYRPVSFTEIEGIVSWAESIYSEPDYLATYEVPETIQD